MTFKEPNQSLTESEFFSLVEKTFPTKWVSSVLIKYEEPKIRKANDPPYPKMHLFTETNEYIITIKGEERRQTSDENTYLGCVAVSRKERAGEAWRRGRDLVEGPCTEITWNRIVADILMYELVKIHKDKAEEDAEEPKKKEPAIDYNSNKAAEELKLRKFQNNFKEKVVKQAKFIGSETFNRMVQTGIDILQAANIAEVAANIQPYHDEKIVITLHDIANKYFGVIGPKEMNGFKIEYKYDGIGCNDNFNSPLKMNENEQFV